MSFNSTGIVSNSNFQELDILPSGYKYCEYIESSGAQYINFDYTASSLSSTDRIGWNIDFTITGTSSDTRYFLFTIGSDSVGHYADYKGENLGTIVGGNSYWFSSYGGTGTRNYLKQVLTSTSSTLTLNNTENIVVTNYQSSTSLSPIQMFALSGSSSNYSKAQMKLYSAQLVLNNSIIYNLIPVLNTLTSKAGLFDTVSQTFYGNSGTGDFTYKLLSNTPASVSSSLSTFSDIFEV